MASRTFFICTHNGQKLADLKEIIKWGGETYPELFQIHLRTLQKFGSVLDPGEIQSRDVAEIARHKARDYYTKLNPNNKNNIITICDDTGLDIPDQLIVGTYIKDVIQQFGLNALWLKSQGMVATFSVAIAICLDPDNIFVQKAEIEGRIADRPPGAEPLPSTATFDNIFIPTGHDVVWSKIDPDTLMKISPRTHALIGAIRQLPPGE
jgi:inosine/xanthosine triphosphate pyrophosphatase family protein